MAHKSYGCIICASLALTWCRQLRSLLERATPEAVSAPIDEEGTTLLHLAANTKNPRVCQHHRHMYSRGPSIASGTQPVYRCSNLLIALCALSRGSGSLVHCLSLSFQAIKSNTELHVLHRRRERLVRRLVPGLITVPLALNIPIPIHLPMAGRTVESFVQNTSEMRTPR